MMGTYKGFLSARAASSLLHLAKYLEIKAFDEPLHVWAMLWWDRMMWFVAHADPPAAAPSVDRVATSV
jgi:hypothetical protein